MTQLLTDIAILSQNIKKETFTKTFLYHFSALKHQLYHQQRVILAENFIALDIKEHLQEPVYRLLLREEQLPAHLPSSSLGVIIVYLGSNSSSTPKDRLKMIWHLFSQFFFSQNQDAQNSNINLESNGNSNVIRTTPSSENHLSDSLINTVLMPQIIRYLLSSYYKPNTLPCTRNIAVTKQIKIPALIELSLTL